MAESCYICQDDEDKSLYLQDPSPCMCKGSIKIHKTCFENIIKTTHHCSICKTKYNHNYLPTRDGLELITEVQADGSIVEYTVNERDEQHGTYIYKSGNNKLIECKYWNGKIHGEYKSWYPNGQLECTCICINNKIDGSYMEWHEDGTIKEHSFYNDGVRDGMTKCWDQHANVIQNTLYIDGEIPYLMS